MKRILLVFLCMLLCMGGVLADTRNPRRGNILTPRDSAVIDGKVTISGPGSIYLGEPMGVHISAPGASAIKVYENAYGSAQYGDNSWVDEYEGDTVDLTYSYSTYQYVTYYAVACFNGKWTSKSKTITVTMNRKGADIPSPTLATSISQITTGQDLEVKVNKINRSEIEEYGAGLYFVDDAGEETRKATAYSDDLSSSVISLEFDGAEINKPGRYKLYLWTYAAVGYEALETSIDLTATGQTAAAAPSFELSATQCQLFESVTITSQAGFSQYEILVTPPSGSNSRYRPSSNSTSVTVKGAGKNTVKVRGLKNGLWTDWSAEKTVTTTWNGKADAVSSFTTKTVYVGVDTVLDISPVNENGQYVIDVRDLNGNYVYSTTTYPRYNTGTIVLSQYATERFVAGQTYRIAVYVREIGKLESDKVYATVTASEIMFVLPSSLTTIESEAFKGVPTPIVKIPRGTSVADDAFDDGVTIQRK